MHELTLSYKTGFKVLDVTKPVIIRDQRGILFYSTEALVPRVKVFNLPAGTYQVDAGSFRALDTPVMFRLAKLPPPDRIHPSPVGFALSFEENENKATINFIERNIKLDNQFFDKPLPSVFFLRYHEYAHQFFGGGKRGEMMADLLAHNFMLIKGFNPSQIGRAQITSLSCRQVHRKKFLINKIKQANGVNS